MIKLQQYIVDVLNEKKHGILPVFIKCILSCLSVLYFLPVFSIILARELGILRPKKLSCPVISVGNITLGGTGKTPTVAFLTQIFINKGKKVGILSHGYKRKGKDPFQLVKPADTNASNVGDEPYLLASVFPQAKVVVGTDRIETGKYAVENGCDILLLDDGFQRRWQLKRDLDIVLIDASYPFGNRRLFPRGPLREPVSSLKEADLFIITKVEPKQDLKIIKLLLQRYSTAPIVEAKYKPCWFYNLEKERKSFHELIEKKIPLKELKGKKVLSLSAIAGPVLFERMLENLKIDVIGKIRYMDHHSYTADDIDHISILVKENSPQYIITTEKDAVRLFEFPLHRLLTVPVLALKIEMECLSGKETLLEKIGKL